MISLEELKRLYREATKIKPNYCTNIIPREENGSRIPGVKIFITNNPSSYGFEATIKDRKLLCYLRNHCEEIIKILEERE